VRAQRRLPFDPLQDDEAQINAFVAARAQAHSDRLAYRLTSSSFSTAPDGSHTVGAAEPLQRRGSPSASARRTLFIEQDRLDRLVARLTHLGFAALHVHAQGDGAVRAALDAIEAVRVDAQEPGAEPKHTIAHLRLIDPPIGRASRARRRGQLLAPLGARRHLGARRFAPRSIRRRALGNALPLPGELHGHGRRRRAAARTARGDRAVRHSKAIETALDAPATPGGLDRATGAAHVRTAS
jgi:hypothetical protein